MHTCIEPEEILRRIREKVAEGRNRKVAQSFHPPVPADFRPDTQLLCFDQTLSNCGWALISTHKVFAQPKGFTYEDQYTGIVVLGSGTIRPAPTGGVKGFEATFTKAVLMAREVGTVLSQYGVFDRVVLELPSVVGYRTESSLVAAVTICVELDRMGREQPEFVSRQAAGTLLCGDRHAPKAVSSELVDRLVPEHPTGTGQWTEHVRDAVFVGLKSLYQEEK